jgi:hypothetical protein
MRRRDIPKVLLASAAGTALAPVQVEAAAESTSGLADALKASGAIRVENGRHAIAAKVQITTPCTIVGDSRNDTLIVPAPFKDYVLEVGDGHPGPNAGAIHRLRFYGAPGNLGCLHMNTLSHMWRLEDLIFSGGPCPALVVDNCWDSNYTNIDIFAHAGVSGDPANDAAVIFRNGSNNIYCRGLRIEGALAGGIYVDGGPIYIVTGKIDDGFGSPQSAAAVTVVSGGSLILDDFYLGGMRGKFHLDVAGDVRLGKVFFAGGTGERAAILDRRSWGHRSPASSPAVAAASTGPQLPVLDLGRAEFDRFHPSVNTETPAAIYSRIHPIRQVRNLTTVGSVPVDGHTLLVRTSLRAPHEDLYRNSFLVHNKTGTQVSREPGARRKILRSYRDGNLLVQGPHPILLDEDWSIEYCASHSTPLQHSDVLLAPGQTLFAVLADDVAIASSPIYVSALNDPAYGTTRFKISSTKLSAGRDVTGLYLVDSYTGEPYFIEFGLDAQGSLGVIHDRTESLRVGARFSVVAGYAADIEVRGGIVSWNFAGRPHQAATCELFAAGYGPTDVPLWGFPAPALSNLTRVRVATAALTLDLASGTEFEITAEDSRPFKIPAPANSSGLSGQRISITLRNASTSPLGALAWDEIYKLAAWTSPAPLFSRSIEFRFDGRHWIEVSRTPVDVPI